MVQHRQTRVLIINLEDVGRVIEPARFHAEGWHASTVNAISTLTDLLGRESPDLVILNTIMPTERELGFCQTIKDYGWSNHRYIPVILIGPQFSLDGRLQAWRNGADECFPHTFTEQELLERAKMLLGLRERIEENRQAQARLQREIHRMTALQRSFLPKQFPTHPRFSIAACYYPSSSVGGDYYDVFKLDEDHWAFLIADIAGHGVVAAVIMAITQMAVREFAPETHSPRMTLLLLNNILANHMPEYHFVTMFYSVLNVNEGWLRFSTAGHNPVMRYSAQRKVVESLEIEPAFPLCTFELDHIDEREVRLDAGDRLLFFTDGVLDLTDPAGAYYGSDRLMKAFANHAERPAAGLVDAIYQDTEQFRQKAERLDDYTMMALSVE